VFIDRSSDRIGIGTVNPQATLNLRSINDSILFGDSGNGWQLDSGTDFSIAQLAGGVLDRLTIKQSGEVGIGTTSPDSLLHVKKFGAKLIVEDSNNTAGVRNVIQLKNKGGVGFEMLDTNIDNAWDFRTASNGGFLVSNIGTPGSKLQKKSQNGVIKTPLQKVDTLAQWLRIFTSCLSLALMINMYRQPIWQVLR